MARRRRDFQLPTSVLLGESISILFANLPSFLLLALVVFSPYFAFLWYSPELQAALLEDPYLESPGSTGVLVFSTVTNFMLPWLLETLLAGMIVYGVVQKLRGTPAPLGQCIVQGFRAFPRLLLTGLLAGVLIGIGLFLIVIPGVYLRCRFFVAVPAAVIERTGPLQSLRRSGQIVQGSMWQVFFALVVIGITQYLLAVLLAIPLTLGDGVPAMDPTMFLLLGAGVTMLISLWTAVASGVAYARLRQHKEHADIDQLAAVFA